MGAIKEYPKKHWVLALDAELAGIPNPAKGDTVFTEDKGKFYYWNGTAWKTGLGYEFVPRAVAAGDFNQGNFTLDGTWKVDGLDLTGIVPVGAVAVLFVLSLKDDAANTNFVMRPNATTKVANEAGGYTQVANVWLYLHPVLNVDSDRLVDYKGDAGMDAISLSVLGWWI